ncbi:MAG: diaminopimelate epimerase [Oscillospiraceae bacterium]|nr:diaminopimelate epimerase [Oscillospiraceae bacterium]MBQ6403989.1 diaminopimelate epimerase [Oscillospiraceae bacterium]
MKFTKMQGCGNDYIYVNCFAESVPDPSGTSIRLSDRHFGVGGDGLVLISPSDTADFDMDMYNADGSRSGMCGNAIRCVGKYVYDRGLTDKKVITISTQTGVKTLWLDVKDGAVQTVRVCMGKPDFRCDAVPVAGEGETFLRQDITVLGETWNVSAVSVGNPHCVTYVDDPYALDFERIGPAFENHPVFPARVNTEFIQIIDEHTLKMRVWERGSGETFACGTGASAALAVTAKLGLCADEADLILRGGTLHIEWDRETDLLYMTGPATFVFDGEVEI